MHALQSNKAIEVECILMTTFSANFSQFLKMIYVPSLSFFYFEIISKKARPSIQQSNWSRMHFNEHFFSNFFWLLKNDIHSVRQQMHITYHVVPCCARIPNMPIVESSIMVDSLPLIPTALNAIAFMGSCLPLFEEGKNLRRPPINPGNLPQYHQR